MLRSERAKLPKRADQSGHVTATTMRGGLAIYTVGLGEPLLLMPYPHGFTLESTAEGPLARLLAGLGRQVITFDPPGAFRSTRPARVDMPEMLESAEETLETTAVSGAVDLVGHSMGGLAALAFTLEQPERVQRLVLVDTIAGGPAIQRGNGMPWNWRWSDPDFWRFVRWGWPLGRGKGNLATHKRLLQLIKDASYVDKSQIPRIAIEAGDNRRPAPVRDRWPTVARRLDYSRRLGQVRAPTLVGVGRFDPQAPVACSEELARGIPRARLVIFERSGHYPFVEEPRRFAGEVVSFFQEDPPPAT